jgi:hypothetical protein
VRIPEVLAGVGGQSQRRLSAAREVMSVLEPGAACRAEPLEETLRAELGGAGVGVDLDGVAGERPMTLIPGAGWAACARLLAEALAGDGRLVGDRAAVVVCPHPDGWALRAGPDVHPTHAVAWTEAAIGDLVLAGHIVAAAGGWASARRTAEGRLRIALVAPAAPSGAVIAPPLGGAVS